MWYVINRKNGQVLEKYNNRLIVPFFMSLIDCKRLKHSNFGDYLSNLPEEDENKSILQFAYGRSSNKIQMSALTDDLLRKNGLDDLRHYYYVYLRQNRELRRKEAITEFNIPDELTRIFKDFFYDHFMSLKTIWSMIGETGFSKQEFHKNFKYDNDMHVCPYCDIDTITNIGSLEIEHFWPESRFPLLAVAPLNLFSSCHACNCVAKKATVIKPVMMPSHGLIGKRIDFQMDIVNKQIDVSSKEMRVTNYLSLLKLISRYKEDAIYNRVEYNASSIYQSIKEFERIATVSEVDIQRYIELKYTEQSRKEPLHFATVALFKDYNFYKMFFHI